MIAEREPGVHILPAKITPYLHPSAANSHRIGIEPPDPGRFLGARGGNDHRIRKRTFGRVERYFFDFRRGDSGPGQGLMDIPDGAMYKNIRYDGLQTIQ